MLLQLRVSRRRMLCLAIFGGLPTLDACRPSGGKYILISRSRLGNPICDVVPDVWLVHRLLRKHIHTHANARVEYGQEDSEKREHQL